MLTEESNDISSGHVRDDHDYISSDDDGEIDEIVPPLDISD